MGADKEGRAGKVALAPDLKGWEPEQVTGSTPGSRRPHWDIRTSSPVKGVVCS
jgi:hypothetical protein